MPNFDPMTGKPLQETPLQETPLQETPLQETSQPPKKSNTAKIVISIVAGVMVLIIVAVAAFFAIRMFLNPKKQLEKATIQTFLEGGYLMDLLKTDSDFEDDGKYTYDAIFEAYNPKGDNSFEGNMTVAVDGDVKQFAGTIGYEGYGLSIPELDFIFRLDADVLKFKIPAIDNRVFTYDYREEKNGALHYYVGNETLQMVDDYLNSLYDIDVSSNQVVTDEFQEDAKEWYEKLEVKSAKAKNFEVDGAERKSKGYVLILNKEDLLAGVELLDDNFREYLIEEGDWTPEFIDYFFEVLETKCSDIEQMEVYFYVYENKLAAIELEFSGKLLQIFFKGGDFRFQNMEILNDGASIFRLEGNIEGEKETIKAFTYDEPYFEVVYERETGEFGIGVWYGEDRIDLNGSILLEPTSLTLSVNEFDLTDYILSGTMVIRKGAEFDELRGEELDIGNADPQEISGILGNIFIALTNYGL